VSLRGRSAERNHTRLSIWFGGASVKSLEAVYESRARGCGSRGGHRLLNGSA